MPARAMMYTGDTPINQINNAETIGIQTLYLLILADLAMLKVGAAIKATTAGRMPLNIFSTASYSLNCWKNKAMASMMKKEGSMVPNDKAKAPGNLRNL